MARCIFRLLGCICAVALVALTPGGCGMPLDEYATHLELAEKPLVPEAPSGPGDGISVIPSYDLQAYVPVPVAGALPVYRITSRADMAVTVVWTDEGGSSLSDDGFASFSEGVVYRAEITLGVKTGYAFDPSACFEYQAGAVGEQSGDTSPEDEGRTVKRSVGVRYKETETPVLIAAGDLDLTGFIPVPVLGGSPVRNLYAGTYGGTVTWSPAHGLFQGGTAYTAEISLYSGAGYLFPEGEVPVRHDGALMTPVMFTRQDNDAPGTIRGTLGFMETGDLAGTIILNYDLQAYVPVPVAGGNPIHSVSTRGDMAVTVVWKDEGGADLGGAFNAFVQGTVYKAEITLTAKAGYAFDPAILFGYPGGTVEEPQGDDTDGEDAGRKAKRFVIVTYKRTEAPVPIATPIVLTHLVSAPVAGGSPETSFYEGTYSGTVTWSKTADSTAHSGLFQAGTAYTATVTLTATPGRVFPESVPVIHGSLSIAPFTGEPRKGTIVFPKGAGSAGVEIGWL